MFIPRIKNIIQGYRYSRAYRKWRNLGKPIPTPDAVKQLIVKTYATKFGILTFVETGTYLGDMILALKDNFNRIYSIELNFELYKKAAEKFLKYKHISIHHGDSSKVLPEILDNLEETCLFWFDAHYSGGITAKGEKDTPILEEINCIFNHSVKDHVILIDDARLFTGENDYPTLETLKELVIGQNPCSIFDVKDDIIRIHTES
jgi:hypothetical protein